MPIEKKEEIGGAISAAMALEVDLKERVRALMVAALSRRPLDRKEVREVLRQAFDGLGTGLSQRGAQVGEAAGDAVRGLDEALGSTVHAMQLTLEEAWGQGRNFAAEDLGGTVDELKGLEEDLLLTLKESVDKGQGVAREVLSGLHDHLRRNGTDTGSSVKAVLDALANRVVAAAHGAGGDLKSDAVEGRERLKAVASGILRGLADGLDKPR